MKFSIHCEALLKSLQKVVGAIERRQTQVILSNVLLVLSREQLSISATDLEVELIARLGVDAVEEAGAVTVPAKKLIDICRNVPAESMFNIYSDGGRVVAKTGRSRFALSTLPTDEFPSIQSGPGEVEFAIKQRDLRYLIEKTQFSMAQHDVRYYLNGLLLHIQKGEVHSVATDGHRLAICTLKTDYLDVPSRQIIMPRKGINELVKLLDDSEETVDVSISAQHFCIKTGSVTFTSKLIDGRFPDYEQVVPRGADKTITIEGDLLKRALSRVSVLSNEKFRAVRMQFRENLLRLVANNPEQEEAEEELEISYSQEDLDVGFNVTYLLDVLSHLPAGDVKLILNDASSGLIIESLEDNRCRYIIMPMKLLS